jgi:putative endonuclease
MREQPYAVYILTNKGHNVLYTGVTGNLPKRMFEHKAKLVDGFSKRYNADKLVHYEVSDDIESAIAREKQIKGWVRAKKIALITRSNPAWNDLSVDLN